MMPLTLAAIGEESLIRRVGGNPETKKHLEDMGFVAGGTANLVWGCVASGAAFVAAAAIAYLFGFSKDQLEEDVDAAKA